LGKTYCTKIPIRIANRTAHTAKRWQQFLKGSLHEKIINVWNNSYFSLDFLATSLPH